MEKFEYPKLDAILLDVELTLASGDDCQYHCGTHCGEEGYSG